MQADCFVATAFASGEEAAKAKVQALLADARLIGAGGLGRVYETIDGGGQRYAVKVVDLPAPDHARHVSTMQRVRREARVGRLLMHGGVLTHAALPSYIAMVMQQAPEQACFVMQLCPGCSLLQLLRSSSSHCLPEGTALSITHQLVHVLQHLHTQGVIYVDLKAENVIWDAASAQAILCDMDLCHSKAEVQQAQAAREQAQQQAAQAGGELQPPVVWGTEEYVAPEVWEQGAAAYSEATDWWALGVLLYEMLYGRTPHAAPTRERLVYNITMRSTDVLQPLPSTGKPPSLPTQSLIRGLLRQRVQYRLGSAKGTEELLSHAAFTGLAGTPV